MKIKWYRLHTGVLQEQASLDGWAQEVAITLGENWFDVLAADPDELRSFLTHFDLHPVQLSRCLDAINDPGVISYGKTLMMEYPTTFTAGSNDPAFLTIIIKESTLVTVRHGQSPSLDSFIHGLMQGDASPLRHIPQIVYLILDHFADLNVDAQIDIRERILVLAQNLARNPASVKSDELSQVRWQVDKLVSLIENQLYCVSALNASDNTVLQEPHRKAYIQDLVAEAEIAQRGVYRLENRVDSLFGDYQLAGNDRVEKRLRFLTIVSSITLPLGLIAGLLGMNVGGLPGTSFSYGFLLVVILMLVIGLLLFWYFKRNGWFE